VAKAVEHAERILPGKPAPDGKRDPRWQAIIKVGGYIESHPAEVWRFARKCGAHPDADLRAAVATCLIEHLLADHFESIIPLVEEACDRSKRFADTVAMCWDFGQMKAPKNQRRWRQLLRRIGKKRTGKHARRSDGELG
jgi:hypothetical protein